MVLNLLPGGGGGKTSTSIAHDSAPVKGKVWIDTVK